NILLQACLSNANVENFALISDLAFVVQNTSRIVRALFEIALNLTLSITSDFVWNDHIHSVVESWWIFVEDSENIELYHSEFFILNRKQLEETQKIRWIEVETFLSVSLNHLILPENYHQHAELLSLPPLPITALKNKSFEEICVKKFNHYNPVQTQCVVREYLRSKVVYITLLKALVYECIDDWQARLTMDGISRSWQHKSYVQTISLVIIDEIHLLSGDRGPILEVFLSRMNYISSQNENKVHIIGLLTALANAQDLADWLCIIRVDCSILVIQYVLLDINIKGFSERHYYPRMATMNKLTFINIMRYSLIKPVIVFVSS
ncbi:508_t:CDS:2, partial [Funneliformis geosporum]